MPDFEEELLAVRPITPRSQSMIVKFLVRRKLLKNETKAERILLGSIIVPIVLVAIFWGASVIYAKPVSTTNPNAFLSGLKK